MILISLTKDNKQSVLVNMDNVSMLMETAEGTAVVLADGATFLVAQKYRNIVDRLVVVENNLDHIGLVVI